MNMQPMQPDEIEKIKEIIDSHFTYPCTLDVDAAANEIVIWIDQRDLENSPGWQE